MLNTLLPMSGMRKLGLLAVFCILWPLDKVLHYNPLWYMGRALVGLFGYGVVGNLRLS
jgi:hypothetical protein